MAAWRCVWGVLALTLAVGCGDKDVSATDDDLVDDDSSLELETV